MTTIATRLPAARTPKLKGSPLPKASFNYKINLKMAIETLMAHKFRSFLTVLGVVIGVVTVIVIASLLTGMRKNIVTLVEEYGTNNIFIFHLNTGMSFGRRPREEWMRKPLTPEDGEAIKALCPSVEDVSWQGFPFRTFVKIKYEGLQHNNGGLNGDTPNQETVSNFVIQEGRFFSAAENERRLPVCVIGVDVVKALFPHGNALGKQIEINGTRYSVIGIMEKRKGSVFGENEEDRTVHIPFDSFRKQFPREDWVFILAKAKSGMQAKAQDEIEELLRRRRKVPWNKENNFSLNTPQALIKQFDSITAQVGMIAIAISGVGLLVGGIGVMNIMLVSVTERTREIGVRKAIGARKNDIVFQFLVEAMSLTGMGGMLGVFLAILVGILIMFLLPSLPASIPAWAVIAGLAVSILTGLIFGVWPAMKAARLDPIEALRHE
jgi:putative ABC transport system permease protein